MASFDNILPMDENAYKIPEKLQSKLGRKPLTDMTNSRKLPATNKSSVKNSNAVKAPEKVVRPKVGKKLLGDLTNSKQPRAQDVSVKKNCTEHLCSANKAQPHSFALEEGFLHNHDECIKVGKKPLGDITNSKQPRAQDVSLKKNCTKHLCSANKAQPHSFALGEGFLHNHDECLKANRKDSYMSFDYFLENVAFKRDSSAFVITPQLPQSPRPSLEKLEIDEMEIEFSDIICASPTPATPRFHGSPSFVFEDLEFSPLRLRLKESPK